MTEPTPGRRALPLWPFRGFRDSAPRDEVGLDELTGASTDWLVVRGRMRRRPGSTIFGDTLSAGVEVAGVLESAIGFLARRMLSCALASMVDLFPSPLILYTEETTAKAGTLAFRSTNGTDAWRTVGKEFSSTHYPTSAGTVANHRVMPQVYRNAQGGMTVHRLNSATARQFMCAGSRDLVQHGGAPAWPGRTSAPGFWNGRWNDATNSGSEGCEVFPLGMIPPLQMPVASKGTDLGASVQGPWKGSDAFFYSMCFENERGELSLFTIPRPPGAAWSGYEGFGYFQVDSANPTHYFDSITFSGLPDGPPGTKYKRLMRSGKVDVSTTGAGAIVQPAADDLQFFGEKIPQGVHTYTATEGNDLSLDPDPRILDMIQRGLQWPPAARAMGRFDGHWTLGGLAPNPHALLVMPWNDAAVNGEITDAALYATGYFVAVTPDALRLRKIGAASVTKAGQENVSGSAVVGLPDLRSLVTGLAISGTGIAGGSTISSLAPLIDTGCGTTSGSTSCVVTNSANNRIGQAVRGVGIQPGTVVTAKPDGTHVTLSLPATVTDATVTLMFAQATLSANCTSSGTARTWTVTTTYEDTEVALDGETLRSLTDHVNADASITNTTFTGATWSAASRIINCGAAPTGLYVGDRVISGAFPSDTVISAIPSFLGGNTILVSQPATRANTGGSEAVTFQHRTAGTSIEYGMQVVPGADGGESADYLLRTYVEDWCTYGSGSNQITLYLMPDAAAYITPGAFVTSGDFPAGTYVTAVNETAGVITVSANSTAAHSGTCELVEFACDTGDTTFALDPGHMRMFGNAFPAPIFWSERYLDRFTPDETATIFSAASPGYPQDGLHTWHRANRMSAPDTFGPLMGFADLGGAQLHFHTRARMRLWNPRTGETHNDADYTKSAVSWTRGARSPYAICAGSGWAVAVCDEGFYVTGGGVGDERFFSQAVFDPSAALGRRGQLEHAIAASIAASESGSDAYRIAAQVHGSILHVRYYASEASTYFDREIRYDFSASTRRTSGTEGPAELFDSDGRPYPWSAPQTLPVSVSAWVAASDRVHHYAARDTNAGTADGRVDEIDYGTTDNGTRVQPVGYTGTAIPADFGQFQPMQVGVVARKAGTGLTVGVARDSAVDHGDMEFDDVPVPSSAGREYVRDVVPVSSPARTVLDALTLRVLDDGTGECPEISRITLYADPHGINYAKGGR